MTFCRLAKADVRKRAEAASQGTCRTSLPLGTTRPPLLFVMRLRYGRSVTNAQSVDSMMKRGDR